MSKTGFKYIDYEHPVESKLDKLVELYTAFYGEKYRKIIFDKLSSAKFFYVSSADKHIEQKIDKLFAGLILNSPDHSDELYEQQDEVLDSLYNSKIFQLKQKYEEKVSDYTRNYIVKNFNISPENFELDQLSDMLKNFVDDNDGNELDSLIERITVLGERGEANTQKLDSLKNLGTRERLLIKFDDLRKGMIKEAEKIYKEDFKAKGIDKVAFSDTILEQILKFSFTQTFSNTAGVSYLTVDSENPTKTVSAVLLNDAFSLCDFVVLHELNHVISGACEVQDGNLSCLSGIANRQFYVFGNDYSSPLLIGGNEQYRPLNEVITDYFTAKIYANMNNDIKFGLYGGFKSSYSNAFPLLSDFIDSHIELIKRAYIENDLVKLQEIFGGKNLRDLAQVIQEFLEFTKNNAEIINNFLANNQGVDLFELSKDTNFECGKKGRKYLSYFAKSREIIEKMNDHAVALGADDEISIQEIE